MYFGILFLCVGMLLMFVIPIINVFTYSNLGFQFYETISNENVGFLISVIGFVMFYRSLKKPQLGSVELSGSKHKTKHRSSFD